MCGGEGEAGGANSFAAGLVYTRVQVGQRFLRESIQSRECVPEENTTCETRVRVAQRLQESVHQSRADGSCAMTGFFSSDALVTTTGMAAATLLADEVQFASESRATTCYESDFFHAVAASSPTHTSNTIYLTPSKSTKATVAPRVGVGVGMQISAIAVQRHRVRLSPGESSFGLASKEAENRECPYALQSSSPLRPNFTTLVCNPYTRPPPLAK